MQDLRRLAEQVWSIPGDDATEIFETSSEGLPEDEIEERLLQYGPNTITVAKPASLWSIWWRQFRSVIVLLLAFAAVISGIVGDYAECIAILVVVLINSLIGFFTEAKALRSMEALKKMTRMMARVTRDGEDLRIPSSQLVPGDWVFVEAGDLVPADIRITQANSLQSDESALTGESLPIRKTDQAQPGDTPLAERKSMLYRGAKVTAGTGQGIVVGTGENSELGKISKMVSEASDHITPLEKQLHRLGYRLVWVTLVMMLVMTLAGVIKGIDLLAMVQTSIALAIAAIPEGLPIVATIALANGLWKMARQNAIINQLSAVETLGSTGIICTDKTGTLTENRMTVSAIWPVGMDQFVSPPNSVSLDDPIGKILRSSVLCNNATVSGEEVIGDPLEVALLEWAARSGVSISDLLDSYPREKEIPFDAEVRKMSTIHKDESGQLIAVKGASEALIPLCAFPGNGGEADLWIERNIEMAKEGLRVIALAERRSENRGGDPDHDLTFLGLIGLIDPPRPEVASAIEECQSAGIRVIMITGDQAPTARAVAESIGIEEGEVLTGDGFSELDLAKEADREKLKKVTIIARSTPVQKLSLVQFYQGQDQIVAMTGDGVNDAPALKQADIGVAMGQRGTDVAREASTMVLQDDSFSTIVIAIRQGRIILENIRKFVIYLMSCNLSEILVVWIAMIMTNQLPLLPLQILFLNLVTDVFPALALGVTPGHGALMSQPPRKAGERVLSSAHWGRIAWYGLILAGATLGAFYFAQRSLNNSYEEAVTIAFLTLALTQLLHVFNMADEKSKIYRSEVLRNRWVWGALGLCVILLGAATNMPVLSRLLHLRVISGSELLIVFGFATLPVLVELIRRLLTGSVVFQHLWERLKGDAESANPENEEDQ